MHTLILWLIVGILLDPGTRRWAGSGSTTVAMVPPDPIQCKDQTGCILSNSYGIWGDRKDCHVLNVTYPKTEEEIRLAVAHANRNKLKVKVVSKFSHTIPKLACPAAGPNSLNSFLISTQNYDSGIEIDTKNLAVTVESGVGLRRLIDEVERVGLSLVASPYWEGVSVGGLISTGAHGSSWWGKGGAVHDHVIGVSMVVPAKPSEGYAKIIKIEASDPLLDAAKVSLGLLGVISKVKFSLEKGFKRSISYNFTDDGGIEDTLLDHAKKYEFADITWYPSRHIAVYRYDNRVPLNASGDGTFDFIGFQPNSVVISKTIRATEKTLENSGNSKGKCTMATTVVGYKKLVANGLKNGLIFTGYPVVGPHAKMQTSGSCLYSTRNDISCAWDPRINGLFFYETTAIFPASVFRGFINDVKKLRDLNPVENFCGVDVYNGFLIRFIKASTAYLGQPVDSVVVDFNYYRANEALTPRLNQDVWEEVEQMAFFKYGAKPHWAKNRNLAFLGVKDKYPSFGKFTGRKKELDPGNIFSSEFSDELLFRSRESSTEKRDGCALEGQCVCTQDRHCRPDKGYFCQPGLVYKEARVCRFAHSSVF
ncbi:L-gulonolactone oxidase 3 [Humulus lupulus]|uniref:L-gulonolactone oxidase 3 n=1 Tax=Humulus lupulus TaxID=3486 RepID=UPI002B414487|nr:L-gulonolactone oxidase 3 [Humulus lupulus]